MRIRKGMWHAVFDFGGNVEIRQVSNSTPEPRMYGGKVIERADLEDVVQLLMCAQWADEDHVRSACEFYDVTIEVE